MNRLASMMCWRGRARAMKVLMRFGSGVPDLPNLIGAYTKVGISPRQLALCTDVLLPEAIFEGGVDIAARKTIEAGIDPVEAIGMGSLNVAEAFRARSRHRIGHTRAFCGHGPA